MTWYSLGLAAGLEKISQDAWRLALEISQAESGPDRGRAIFKQVGPDTRLNLFFTPSAQLVAETFGARRCAKPSPAGLNLVAGSEHAWPIHFGRMYKLRRRIAALRAMRRPVVASPLSDQEMYTPLNQHILELFQQANATPREGATMLLALAAWAADNLADLETRELRPVLDALRQAARQDPASLNALLEESDQQIEQARSLDEAARLLLREVADWMPAARQAGPGLRPLDRLRHG